MTHGAAVVNGFDVYSQLAQARHFMGYCPQYDGLLGLQISSSRPECCREEKIRQEFSRAVSTW